MLFVLSNLKKKTLYNTFHSVPSYNNQTLNSSTCQYVPAEPICYILKCELQASNLTRREMLVFIHLKRSIARKHSLALEELLELL